jgi:hypothetical protein
MLLFGKRQRSVFHVSEAAIVSEQWCAQIHDRNIYETTAGATTVFFGGLNQSRSQARALLCRIDCKQTKISSFALQLHVNAADRSARFFGKQEFAFLNKSAHLIRTGAIAVNKKPLGAKCSVYQTRNFFGVGGFSGAGCDRIHANANSGCKWCGEWAKERRRLRLL